METYGLGKAMTVIFGRALRRTPRHGLDDAMAVLFKAKGMPRSNHKYLARHPRDGGGFWYEYSHPHSGERMVHHRDGDHLPIRSTHRVADVPELAGVEPNHNPWSPRQRMPSMRMMNTEEARTRALNYERSDATPVSVSELGKSMSREVESIAHWRKFAHSGRATEANTQVSDDAKLMLNRLGLKQSEMRRLAGLPNEVPVAVTVEHGKIVIRSLDNAIMTVIRRITGHAHHKRGSLEVRNTIAETVAAGGDWGWRNLLTQVLAARSLEKRFGRTEFSATASSGNDSNGHITWLVDGYRTSPPRFVGDFKHGLPRNQSEQPVEQTVHSPDGRAWWKVNGGDFEARFDPWDRYCLSALSAEAARRANLRS